MRRSAKKTIVDAIRERFGFHFFFVLLVIVTLVSFLVLVSEIGGVCYALQIATGIGFQWWALPVTFIMWLFLWRGTFGIIENGTSILGLATVVFAVAAFHLHPDWSNVGKSLIPSLPSHDSAKYWFTAVSILGASVSPYLMFFYSSGALEDKWDKTYTGINRVVAVLGMTFGGTLSVAVLITAALILLPHGIKVDSLDQLAEMMTMALGSWGFRVFLIGFAVACFGAAMEIALSLSYTFAQGFGWNWGEDQAPSKDSRFAITYTIMSVLAPILIIIGIDPLKLTIISMAFTAASLPVSVFPFLIIMNDKRLLEDQTNGFFSNLAVILIILLTFVVAAVTIPLEIIGG